MAVIRKNECKKKAKATEPERTFLIRDRDIFREELGERLQQGEEMLGREIKQVDELESLKNDYYSWNDYNSELLKAAFNNPKNEYKYRYDNSTQMLGLMDYAQGRYDPNNPVYQLKDARRDIEAKTNNLRNLLEKVELIPSSADESESSTTNENLDKHKRNIFIIHGHDETSLKELKDIIQDDFNLTPFILQKLPNIGSPTIIEKFEFYAKQCSMAIALFTPDDIIEKDGVQYLQARPNVIYELGWFSAKLTRQNVILILKEGTDVFSDFQGILQLRFKTNISEIYRELMLEFKAKGLLNK